ncbi:hypothetical protein NliqN6_3795 [Naganishia liquefaciens]|uniref:Uncharacterized protein n=1 Tax=Naganishia liquefaciens TaxID=104408 RepID=A0A8H3TUZ9_9TREE|nr:hypothetical protein NliqN6_3795 [Naganishia liquefaciens]
MTAPYEQHTDAQTVGRAVGFRMFKSIRRGQLPLLLVFFACVMIFFGALSGIGYTDNTEKALSADEMLVHAMKTDQQFSADLEAKLGEMKRLENEWAAKRRTAKDGAWMKSNRDQKAIRRKPLAKTPQEKKLMEQQAAVQAQSEESTSVEESTVDVEPEGDAGDAAAGGALE